MEIPTIPASQQSHSWTVAQIGAREHYGIPRGFQQAGMLRELHTDMWCRSSGSLWRHGPGALRAFASRQHVDIPSNRVYSHNLMAFKRSLLSPKPRSRADEYYRFIETGKWFAEAVMKQMQRSNYDGQSDRFFAFNTGCLELLPFLRQRGVFSVVDQIDPGKTEERLVLEEIERWPGWQPKPDTIPQAYFDRLKAEWDGANLVVVNSDWSRIALIEQGVPDHKITVVPLSIEPSPVAPAQKKNETGVINVLWLGNVILRKGIQYLIEAARLLQSEKRIRFIIAGPIGISESAVKSAPSNVEFVGRVMRDQAKEFYASADLFVLPTVSDGFALTQLEAMAYGLPVIATPNCGQVVNEGVDGFIVPARNAELLAERILRVSSDADLRKSLSINALKRSKDFPLSLPTEMIEAATGQRLNQRIASCS